MLYFAYAYNSAQLKPSENPEKKRNSSPSFFFCFYKATTLPIDISARIHFTFAKTKKGIDLIRKKKKPNNVKIKWYPNLYGISHPDNQEKEEMLVHSAVAITVHFQDSFLSPGSYCSILPLS